MLNSFIFGDYYLSDINMIKAVIIDDEKNARISLIGDLVNHCPEIEILAEADGVKNGLEIINKFTPELVFLDVSMGDGTGFDLLQKVAADRGGIDKINFNVIFTTAHDNFAINAFKFGVIDYLLKPVNSDELINAVEKVKTKIAVEIEREKSDSLIKNVFSLETAEELKSNGFSTVKHFENVSVMFTDFVGFTMIAEKLTETELVIELNKYFIRFDEIIEKYGLEKIKTIGDSYMCAGGIPKKDENNTEKMVLAALEIRQYVEEINKLKKINNLPEWHIRIGIHTGSVVAGVLGKKKFAYDIWGDTVNVASRMESSCENGKINISGAAYEFVKDFFEFSFRGKISAKNKSDMDMYFVESEL